MTKATAKKVASTKPTTKITASKKPSASYAGQVLIGLTFPLVCNSIQDLNTLELCCLGFIAAAPAEDLNQLSNHCTVDYIYKTISTMGGKNVHRTEVIEAFETLNRRRLIKKNLMKSLDGSSEKYYTLSTRGEKLVNYMQCELWNVIRSNEMKA